MSVSAGRRAQVIQLQSPPATADAGGWVGGAWTTRATEHAEVEPLRGREALLAAQRQSAATHRVALRYNPSLAAMDSTWRVKWGPRIFEIESVKNVGERDRDFELLCVEHLQPAN